jgi:hypothetical protein
MIHWLRTWRQASPAWCGASPGTARRAGSARPSRRRAGAVARLLPDSRTRARWARCCRAGCARSALLVIRLGSGRAKPAGGPAGGGGRRAGGRLLRPCGQRVRATPRQGRRSSARIEPGGTWVLLDLGALRSVAARVRGGRTRSGPGRAQICCSQAGLVAGLPAGACRRRARAPAQGLSSTLRGVVCGFSPQAASRAAQPATATSVERRLMTWCLRLGLLRGRATPDGLP